MNPKLRTVQDAGVEVVDIFVGALDTEKTLHHRYAFFRETIVVFIKHNRGVGGPEEIGASSSSELSL